jgi:hypothetical protein
LGTTLPPRPPCNHSAVSPRRRDRRERQSRLDPAEAKMKDLYGPSAGTT